MAAASVQGPSESNDRILRSEPTERILRSEPTERILRIQGGQRLDGRVRISGAKNAALKALAASLLTDEEVVLNNVPMIADVLSMADLLREFGAEVEVDRANERVRVQTREVARTDAPPSLFKATRASVVVTGPMLARAGEISFALPGGDQIGKRPIDMHLKGFARMGTEVERGEDVVHARVNRLHGARIYMDYPSHTGTEALMMAATRAAGTTTIMNASYEPEIVWLGNMLNRMGARISGLGTPFITIEGVERLRGVSEIVLPDRLEAATFAVAAVITGGQITLEDVTGVHLVPITEKLAEAGAEVWRQDNRMLIKAGSELRAVDIQTLPYPGFPTDSQSTFMPLLTQATGVSRVHERVYEDRLRYTDELLKMGADIRVQAFGENREVLATSADVHGPTPLTGVRVRSLDIRSAVGVVLAGLVAEGETQITDVHHIDRGYQDFVGKLAAVGADIVDTDPPA
ncbi:UDP-N-acetylglucosamine 1-carboxyvinyltransferase [Parenemella sanctibonifatiensis]|uniref:UDP-N-acetylglucosamine 1-carboxyvinyltransferase n=1 Tax=Parenemella sanctibonifatiensis TaxID=2016505 RepID=A0A255DXT9_9ACTN|nr:UDP-N-acetylglucosamine 1-carboxyvinyltransferase [Parenemella sanctibonifatiensis]OYN84084.1 UDP-N-acetylglucosamine 1-carboxyvinyltransferase [Parenemella sanctibonifatiensis]